MTSPFAVVTDGLTKRFGDFTAVDHIDLEVEAGTVLSLLGPNGAGKTTTVRMLATLSAPTSGTARICGHDVVTEADTVRGLISLTGQFAALETNLTAREVTLALMARLRGYGRPAAGTVWLTGGFTGSTSASSGASPRSRSRWPAPPRRPRRQGSSRSPACSCSTSRPPGSTRPAARWSGPP